LGKAVNISLGWLKGFIGEEIFSFLTDKLKEIIKSIIETIKNQL